MVVRRKIEPGPAASNFRTTPGAVGVRRLSDMPERTLTPSPRDAALSAALGVAAAFELTLAYAFERTPEPGPTPVHFVVVALISLALVWRRVLPLVAPVLVAIVLAIQPQLVAFPNVYVEIF